MKKILIREVFLHLSTGIMSDEENFQLGDNFQKKYTGISILNVATVVTCIAQFTIPNKSNFPVVFNDGMINYEENFQLSDTFQKKYAGVRI